MSLKEQHKSEIIQLGARRFRCPAQYRTGGNNPKNLSFDELAANKKAYEREEEAD